MYEPDVLVIGAGPAGSCAAAMIAAAGFEVAIFEKRRIPRPKTCAGGLTARAVELLPIRLDELAERRPDTIEFRLGCESFQRRAGSTIVTTVRRDRFDAALAARAVELGCAFFQEEEVISLAFEERRPEAVTATGRMIWPRIVIGADGANGVSARQLGFSPWDACDIGIEADVPLDSDGKPPLVIEWGLGRGTYGWSFPRREDRSLGVKGPVGSAHLLMRHMKARLGGIDPAVKPRGHRIPYRLSRRPIVLRDVMLVGDAAGLADPWSGEGLTNAIRSASMAADAALARLHTGRSLLSYQQAIDAGILQEQRASHFYNRLFDLDQRFFYRFTRDNEKAWRAFCSITSGRSNFATFWPPHRALYSFLKG